LEPLRRKRTSGGFGLVHATDDLEARRLLDEMVLSGRAEVACEVPLTAAPGPGPQPLAVPEPLIAHPVRIEPKYDLILSGKLRGTPFSTPLCDASKPQTLADGLLLTTAERPDGKRRLIVQMNFGLNALVLPQPYSIDSVQDWAAQIPDDCLVASVDTKAAFHSMFLLPEERHRYCAAVLSPTPGRARIYRLKSTGFGSNLAPFVYALLQSVTVADFNLSMSHAFPADPLPGLAYADDVALRLPRRHATRLYRSFLGTLMAHGFSPSVGKCAPPAGQVEHTGLLVGADGSVRLPDRRRRELSNLARSAALVLAIFFCHVCYRPGLRGSRQPRRALGRSARPSHSGRLGWLPSAGLLQLTRSAPGYTPQQ